MRNAATVPVVREVVILVEGPDRAQRTYPFPTLVAADAALGRWIYGPDHLDGRLVAYSVTWTDGVTHHGPIDLSPTATAAGRIHGGHLRAQLLAPAEFLRGDTWHQGHARLHYDERVKVAAWAGNLRDRVQKGEDRRSARNGARGAPAATSSNQVPIVAVEVGFSENRAVPRGATFPSLWAADAALAAAFAREAPPPGGAYDKTDFTVRWADGFAYTGRADVSEFSVAAAPRRGGILRAHLSDRARFLASEDHLRMFLGHRSGAQLAADRELGLELLRRLAHDVATHVDPTAPRNRAGGARARAVAS